MQTSEIAKCEVSKYAKLAKKCFITCRKILWCKMRFFRDMLRNDIEGERTAIQRGPVGLLSMLPNEFTHEDVKALRIAQGMSPDPRDVLSKWVKRGNIAKDPSRGMYVKCGQ